MRRYIRRIVLVLVATLGGSAAVSVAARPSQAAARAPQAPSRAAKAPSKAAKAPSKAAKAPSEARPSSAAPVANTQARRTAASVRIVGATVWTAAGQVVENAALELENGKIARIAAAGAQQLSARDIDARGKIITPGFIAAHTSLGLVEIEMEDGTRNDRGAKQDPIRASFDASMAIDADSALLPIQAIEGVTSAAVTPTGGLLAGQIAWIDLLRGHYGDIVVRSRLAVVADPSSDALVSTAAGWTRLREVLSDAQYYQRHKAAFERRQLRDLAAHRLDLEALVPVVTGKVPLVVRAHRASDISAALALAREFGLELVIVGGAQAWKVAPTLARAKATVIVQPSENVPGTMDEIGARLDNAAILVRAGVAVGIARLGDAHNVRNLKQEAGIAIASGLDRDAALAAVTINIARAFGMDKEYGSIEPGKVANLVVWPADPFELSSFPTQVYIRGEAIPMTSRQTLLRDRYLQRKAKK